MSKQPRITSWLANGPELWYREGPIFSGARRDVLGATADTSQRRFATPDGTFDCTQGAGDRQHSPYGTYMAILKSQWPFRAYPQIVNLLKSGWDNTPGFGSYYVLYVLVLIICINTMYYWGREGGCSNPRTNISHDSRTVYSIFLLSGPTYLATTYIATCDNRNSNPHFPAYRWISSPQFPATVSI